MSFIDIFLMTIRSLWRRKARTFLTVLGVIIGTACIVIMIALGLGNEKAYYEQISQNADLTQISIYHWGGGYGDNNKLKLDDAAIRAFYDIPGVKSATPVLNFPISISTDRYTAQLNVLAVNVKAMKKAFEVEQGMTLPENPLGKLDIVLGYGTLNLFQRKNSTLWSDTPPDIDWINAKYEMTLGYSYDDYYDSDMPKSKKYKPSVIGVMPENYNEYSYSAIMDITDAKKMFAQNKKLAESMSVDTKNYQQAYVYCVDMDHVVDVLKYIRDEMGFEASSNTEWIKTQQEEIGRQRAQLASIGLISLLVSAIGIANTMLTNIMERTREIGIMKVLGCPLIKINTMFLTEAAMIGLIGGLLGVGISFAFKIVVPLLGTSVLEFLNVGGMMGMGMETQMIIPAWLAFIVVGGAMVIGVLSGMYPAWRAMRMSPLAAIRSE